MALKDLLVYLDETPGSLGRLSLAADLARRHRSRLTALYVREWTPAQLAQRRTAELAGRPMSDVRQLDQTVEASIDSCEGRLRTELQRLADDHGLDVEWRSVAGDPLDVLPQHARHADLSILDVNTPATSTAAGYRFSEEMLFVAGRPVLFVPAVTNLRTLGRHIAIAWNSSRAAARSLHDALPLIEQADEITVLTVNGADFIDRHGALPLPELIAHLGRHGVAAKSIEANGVPAGQIGEELQTRARALGADLLVAGAYGHSRLREILMGGVTRDLLSRMTLPIMMSY
ncbi:MAG TPA: universal stress protein [Steroidobacteraceae bacterium]|nr:universal stress protein [Steroidobacteraceae bacterium]